MKTLYIVVPCYNEEECLPKTAPIFFDKLCLLIDQGIISHNSRILYVDDGSQDGTWDIIRSCHQDSHLISGLRLSPNRGHQNAVMAGLMEAQNQADMTISIDCDLQDDINVIDKMVELCNSGFSIVCGVRDSRASDTFLKRFTAQAYYTMMNFFGAKIIFDHADFRLMDKIALEKLSFYHGDDLFLRGLVTRLGLPLTTVTYGRTVRVAGESKYTIRKMLKLAIKGFSCNRLHPAATPRPRDSHIVEIINI